MSIENPNSYPADNQNRETPEPIRKVVAKKTGLPESLTAKEAASFTANKGKSEEKVAIIGSSKMDAETARFTGLPKGFTEKEAMGYLKNEDKEETKTRIELATKTLRDRFGKGAGAFGGLTNAEASALKQNQKEAEEKFDIRPDETGEIPKSIPQSKPDYQHPADAINMNLPGGLTKEEAAAIIEEIEKPEETHLETRRKDQR